MAVEVFSHPREAEVQRDRVLLRSMRTKLRHRSLLYHPSPTENALRRPEPPSVSTGPRSSGPCDRLDLHPLASSYKS